VDSLSEVRFDDFDAALTPARVRRLQLCCAPPLVMVVVTWTAAVAIYLAGGAGEQHKESMLIVQVATAFHAFGFFVNAPLWFLFTGRWLSPGYLAKAAHREIRALANAPAAEPADKCVSLIEKMVWMRTLALGSAAGTGVVAVCIAAIMVVLPDHPVYWLNGVTTIPFLVWAAMNFPTRERLQALFLDRIAAA
jgi:hypothetical protein